MCLSGFRLFGLSPSAVRRCGCYSCPHLTFLVDDRVDARTEPVSPPTSFAQKNDEGFWYVAVTWGNGRKERLGPYKSEAVAQELIKAQLAAWHEGQKLFRKSPR
jgi:hypothetical protein